MIVRNDTFLKREWKLHKSLEKFQIVKYLE